MMGIVEYYQNRMFIYLYIIYLPCSVIEIEQISIVENLLIEQTWVKQFTIYKKIVFLL